MKATRIEWLHRLGIDVWKFRDTPVSILKDVEAEPGVAPAESNNTFDSLGKKRESNESESYTGATPAHVFTETKEVAPGEGDSSDNSPRALPTVEEPSIELKCSAIGTCLVVFDPNVRNSNDMAMGIGYAASRYKARAHDSVGFSWPPTLSTTKDHGGWESASRAFRSLINRQDWTFNFIVSVGSDANRITKALPSPDIDVLKLDEFPANAQTKKELWQRIAEML
ncbi:MAG: hypothetical protein OXG24_13525 [Gammaproteobacteria bacterium]|nr:hypothetical protein [Gammaproteobacteria bacterium]